MFKLGVIISLTVVLLLTVVSCYDFDNSEYNRILAEELEELHEDEAPSSVHTRARRDEEATSAATATKDKCKKPRFRGCCADDTMEALHDEDKQIKKDCYKEITGHERPTQSKIEMYFSDHFKCDKDRVDKHKKEMTCVFQCVGQKRKVVDASGKLVEAEFKKILKDKFSKFEAEAWLLPKLDDIGEKCYKEAMHASSKQEKVDKDNCDPSTIKASFCLWREIQMACPASKIKDEKYCSKLRERMKSHPENPFRPSLMMMGDFE